jgi:hypothetical protein
MRIGFNTRYHRRDPTFMALQVARLVERAGSEASVLSDTQNVVPVDPLWDRRVVYPRTSTFTAWARKQDIIVWTHIPPRGQLEWCQGQGIHTVLLFPWDEFNHFDDEHFRSITRIVAPIRAAGALLRATYSLTNVTTIPWAASLPLVRKPPKRDTSLRLFMPMTGCQPLRMELAAVDMMQRLAQYAHVTVCYDVVSGQCRRRLLRAAKKQANLQVVQESRASAQQLHFAAADLTVWPSLVETSGLAGLRSLTLGTPLVAFKQPPTQEFVAAGRNGALVTGSLMLNQMGVPFVQPNYAAMEATILELLSNTTTLRQLQAAAGYSMPARQQFFDEQWIKLLGLVIPE